MSECQVCVTNISGGAPNAAEIIGLMATTVSPDTHDDCNVGSALRLHRREDQVELLMSPFSCMEFGLGKAVNRLAGSRPARSCVCMGKKSRACRRSIAMRP